MQFELFLSNILKIMYVIYMENNAKTNYLYYKILYFHSLDSFLVCKIWQPSSICYVFLIFYFSNIINSTNCRRWWNKQLAKLLFFLNQQLTTETETQLNNVFLCTRSIVVRINLGLNLKVSAPVKKEGSRMQEVGSRKWEVASREGSRK